MRIILFYDYQMFYLNPTLCRRTAQRRANFVPVIKHRDMKLFSPNHPLLTILS